MNRKRIFDLSLAIVIGLSWFPGDCLGTGQVYLVLGSDTAIWEGMSTSTYHCTYDIDLYTNPSRNAYGIMDPAFRAQFVDSYGQPLKMTWWMMAGNIFRYATNTNVPVPNIMTLYLMKKYHGDNAQINGDELSLHYHTFAWTDDNGDGLSYWNQSQTFMECCDDWNVTLAQLLLEEEVFPVSFRSGWHYMDNGWQFALDGVLPYSLHNASPSVHSDTTEPLDNNYDWSQASTDWIPFHPSPENYQLPGDGPGWNVRCRHFGWTITSNVIEAIFAQADGGVDQVACIWGHLPETDFLANIAKIDSLAHEAAALYPNVNFSYCTAIEAMQRWRGMADMTAPNLALWEIPSGDEVFFGISSDEPIFQPVPFVAVKTIYEQYLVLPCQAWGTNQWETTGSLPREQLARVGAVVCDTLGNQAMAFIDFLPDDIYVDNVDSGYVEVQKSWSTSPECAWGLDSRVTTLSAGDTARARWYPHLEDSALCNIFVQIPEVSNPAEQITYRVFNQGICQDTVLFTSAPPAAEWIYVTTSYLMPDGGTYLQMEASGDGQEGRTLCADVARFTPLVRERDLHVVTQILDFGTVGQEDSVSLDLRLENRGCADLTVSGISSLHEDLTVPSSFPVVIPGMGSANIPVDFHPCQIGAVNDEMFIHSDDPIEPMASVLVVADVQPYFVIVDNDDSLDYQEEGSWHTSVAQAYGPSSRYAFLHQSPGARARFSALLEKGGIYRIFEIVPHTANATDQALCVLSIEGLEADSICVNQNSGSGSWIQLWTHPLACGQNVEVRVEDAGGSTQGDVLRADAVKLAVTVPPKAVDDLTIMIQGGSKSSSGNVHLHWTEPENCEGIDHYVIYRSEQPGQCGDSLAWTIETVYIDSGAIGDADVQHFYSIVPVDEVGNRSENSSQVGEFDQPLTAVK